MAVRGDLVLDGCAVDVAGTVVVAGQDVLVLCAKTDPVIGCAGVGLDLSGGKASIEDAVTRDVSDRRVNRWV